MDNVNHPGHYETGKFECIEVMQEAMGIEEVKSFCLCNAFKYLYRSKRKNGLEDIKKAIWYLNKFIELNENLEKVPAEYGVFKGSYENIFMSCKADKEG